MPPEFRLVVNQRHVSAEVGGFGRCGQTGRSPANNRNIGMTILVVIAAFGFRLGIDFSQACRPTEKFFCQRPEKARTNKGLIVEADRQQPVKAVNNGQQVVLERGPRILWLDAHALSDGLGTGADAGRAIHVHETVRTLPRAA